MLSSSIIPSRPNGGPCTGGHAVSEDLVSWEELPIALYPDMPYENGGGCFFRIRPGKGWGSVPDVHLRFQGTRTDSIHCCQPGRPEL